MSAVEHSHRPGTALTDLGRQSSMFFIVNGRAGRCDANEVCDRLRDHCRGHQIRWNVFVRREKGQSRKHATRRALEQGFRTIVAVGGDGTISKVASQLVGKGVTLGIVPTGSANVLARDLGIPLDVTESLSLLTGRAEITHMDGMGVGKRTLFSHVSMGTYSRVAGAESTSQKQRFGTAAYLWHMFREVRRGRAWEFELVLDGRLRRVRASLVLAANAAATGLDGVQWGDHIAINDRTIDVCIVRARTLGGYVRLFWETLRGETTDSDLIEYERVNERLVISTASSIPVRGDGKTIGQRQVTIKVLPAVIPVIVPIVAIPDFARASGRKDGASDVGC